ncbi:MAG: response regulator transcription factor [Verrucomicrobiales bacterium]|nr:response regulator transcription factor [Verrucomicrobiales bacterium]
MMKCLVVDDDPLVCETVESFLSRAGGVEYCIKATDGLTALNLLSTGSFDVVFLDLQMPELDGESLLRALPRDLPVVVVSASSSFGAKSYEFNVADYLVKPLEFPRFLQALQKVKARSRSAASGTPGTASIEGGEVFVKDGTRIQRVDLSRLLFVKAEANYADFVSDEGSFLSLMSLKRLEELLPDPFLRVHRSYIINRRRISRIEDGNAVIGHHKIPIGESYRDDLMRRLGVVS